MATCSRHTSPLSFHAHHECGRGNEPSPGLRGLCICPLCIHLLNSIYDVLSVRQWALCQHWGHVSEHGKHGICCHGAQNPAGSTGPQWDSQRGAEHHPRGHWGLQGCLSLISVHHLRFLFSHNWLHLLTFSPQLTMAQTLSERRTIYSLWAEILNAASTNCHLFNDNSSYESVLFWKLAVTENCSHNWVFEIKCLCWRLRLVFM